MVKYLDYIIIFSGYICTKPTKSILTKKDIFLASFPRSGNTWMRLLLSDLILQMQGFSTNTGGVILYLMFTG